MMGSPVYTRHCTTHADHRWSPRHHSGHQSAHFDWRRTRVCTTPTERCPFLRHTLTAPLKTQPGDRRRRPHGAADRGTWLCRSPLRGPVTPPFRRDTTCSSPTVISRATARSRRKMDPPRRTGSTQSPNETSASPRLRDEPSSMVGPVTDSIPTTSCTPTVSILSPVTRTPRSATSARRSTGSATGHCAGDSILAPTKTAKRSS